MKRGISQCNEVQRPSSSSSAASVNGSPTASLSARWYICIEQPHHARENTDTCVQDWSPLLPTEITSKREITLHIGLRAPVLMAAYCASVLDRCSLGICRKKTVWL